MNNGSNGKAEAVEISLAKAERTEGKQTEPKANVESAKPDTDSASASTPDPEVTEKTVKRKFSVEYKARIVREADACTETGQIGALLRREGLYSSQLAQWRRAYEKGALAGLKDDKRGRKRTRNPLESENEKLKRKNARLEQRLEQAQVIIDIQKKLSGLMGIPLPNEEDEGKS